MGNKQLPRSVVRLSDEEMGMRELVKRYRDYMQRKEYERGLPSMTEWDGSRGRSAADNVSMALVAPPALGALSAAVPTAARMLLEGTKNKAAIGAGAGIGAGIEGYNNPGATPADIGYSALEGAAATYNPVKTLLAQAALGSDDAKAVIKPNYSTVDDIIAALGKKGFASGGSVKSDEFHWPF